jgi:DNA-binding PadR family transcriptional regulator
MSAAASLGEFELLVLLTVMRHGQTGYAVSVRAELESSAGRPVSRGAVYVTLDRLEHKGLVRSWLGEPTAERGGKAKRLFEVTPEGRTAAQAALQRTQSLAAGLGLERT